MENFYVIYGADKTLVKYEADCLIKKLKCSDVIRYDMNSSLLLDVIDDASTVGMFSNKKIIVLEDSFFLTANKTIPSLDQLEEYVEHFNHDNCCIFLVYNEKIDTRKKINKLLSKHKMIEVKKQDTTDLTEFVKQYLKNNHYEMEDISYFLKQVGSALPNIQNELDKLMMYRFEEKRISNDDVDKVCIFTSEEEIFSFTDAIIAKDMFRSFKLLEEFLNKSYDEMQIIMLLASQFRFFFQVKRLLNKQKSESEIAKVLEVNPYRVKFTVKKLYYYSEGMLLDYIQKIAKIDHDIKLGLMDKKLALELFITMNVS